MTVTEVSNRPQNPNSWEILGTRNDFPSSIQTTVENPVKVISRNGETSAIFSEIQLVKTHVVRHHDGEERLVGSVDRHVDSGGLHA